MGDGLTWNPGWELRAREHVTLERMLLHWPRGLWIPRVDGSATIVLDVRLLRERQCTLAHELVHDERRICDTSSNPDGLVQLAERCVKRQATRRRVPPAELLALVAAMATDPVLVIDVADGFDVDQRTARQACALLG